MVARVSSRQRGKNVKGRPGLRVWFFRAMLDFFGRHRVLPAAGLQIQILLGTTARAFGVRSRPVWYLPREKALRAYAAFTLACMRGYAGKGIQPEISRQLYPKESRLKCGTCDIQPEVSRRLYRHAYRLGSRIRAVTGFTTPEDQTRLVFYLYRLIGIRMSGRLPGMVTISSCYFSRCYTPEQCAVMSAMDAGIMAGICGGGRLVFTERITEGCGRCCALMKQK